MRFVLTTLLIAVIAAISYGYYLKGSGDMNGEIIIGVSVIVIAFIIMPLFIYHRYKNKDLSSFNIENFSNHNTEDEEKKEKNS